MYSLWLINNIKRVILCVVVFYVLIVGKIVIFFYKLKLRKLTRIIENPEWCKLVFSVKY